VATDFERIDRAWVGTKAGVEATDAYQDPGSARNTSAMWSRWHFWPIFPVPRTLISRGEYGVLVRGIYAR